MLILTPRAGPAPVAYRIYASRILCHKTTLTSNKGLWYLQGIAPLGLLVCLEWLLLKILEHFLQIPR